MICQNCVYLPSLKKYVSAQGLMGDCDYCQLNSVCVDDEDLADFIVEKAANVLVSTDRLSFYQKHLVFEAGYDGPHIFQLWNFFDRKNYYACDEFMNDIIKTIREELDEDGYTGYFVLNDGTLEESNIFERRWQEFLFSINNKNRFFNKQAIEFLDDLFAVLLVESKLDSSIVYVLDIEEPIYRARISVGISTLEEIDSDPERQLGPAPAHLASNQRMSPEGISVFYGALDRATCISEIRPLVGDSVISGEFRALTNLKLLDLNKLASFRPNIDVFDDNYIQHAHASAFFKELVFQMSRPARRGTGNPYLSTQVIFEYLSVRFANQVDGVMYRSVQQDQVGQCISLFPNKSNVSRTASNKICLTDNTCEKNSHDILFFVAGSLRYHKVRAVAYQQFEYDNEYVSMCSALSKEI